MTTEILIGLVAFIHCYIFIFEMFAWEQRGPKVFSSFPKDMFARTKPLARNMGLYNGFLAAGLMWSFFINEAVWQTNIRLFCLSCVVVAGVVGALTAERKIFWVQALPAIVALLFLIF